MILLVQSFTARMPLLKATSAFGLCRRHWSTPQQCYLHSIRTLCLCTLDIQEETLFENVIYITIVFGGYGYTWFAAIRSVTWNYYQAYLVPSDKSNTPCTLFSPCYIFQTKTFSFICEQHTPINATFARKPDTAHQHLYHIVYLYTHNASDEEAA